MAEATKPPRRRRRVRRWLTALGVLFLLIIIFVALLPTLINAGLGQGIIRSSINDSINGTVALGDVHLSWFGGQSIKGLTITDAAGKQAAKLDATINAGLAGILAKHGPLEVALSGTLDGQVREDGSISFADLFAEGARRGKTPKPRSAGAGKPFSLPDLPPTTARINGLTVNLTNLKTNQTLALNNVNGTLAYVDPAKPIALDLHGKTLASNTPGSIDVTGKAVNLFDQKRELNFQGAAATLDVDAKSIPLPTTLPQITGINEPANLQAMTLSIKSDDLTGKIVMSLAADAQIQGRVPTHVKTDAAFNKIVSANGKPSLRGASASINSEISNLPLIAGDVKAEVQTLTATVQSDDLTKSMVVAANGQGQIEGNAPSTLTANVSVADPFKADGSANFDLKSITGTVKGKTIPTAVAQAALKETPIVLARDVGPTADLDATFSSGEARDVSITAVGAKARLEVKANVKADGGLTGSHLVLAAPAAHPDLVRGFTSLNVDQPTDVTINLTSFTLPPKDAATDARPLAKFAAAGTIQINGPAIVHLAPAAAPATTRAQAGPAEIAITVQAVTVKIESPALGDHLKLAGSAIIDGANATFDQTITNLFDSRGTLAPMDASPVGTLTVQSFPASTLAAFVPDQRDVLDEVIGKAASLTLTTSQQGDNLSAELEVNGERMTTKLNAVRQPGKVTLLGGQIALTATPQLAALLQKESQKPIVLTEPAKVTVDLQEADFVRDASGKYQRADQPVGAIITVDSALLDKVPSLVEPLRLQGIVAQATLTREGSYQTLAVNGDAELFRAKVDQLVTRARYKGAVKIRPREAEGQSAQSLELVPQLDLGLVSLSMRHLERMLGKPRGTISDWTGDEGGIALHLAQVDKNYTAAIHSEMPNIQGDFKAISDTKLVWLTAETSTLMVKRDALERRLNGRPMKRAKDAPEDQPDPQTAGNTLHVKSDLPLTLNIRNFTFPLAMLQDKPFDPAGVQIDLALKGGPLEMASTGGASAKLSDLDINAFTSNLSTGIGFALKAKAEGTAPAAPEHSEAAESAEQTKPERPNRRNARNAASTQPAVPAPAPGTPGGLDVTGKLVDLVSQDNTLNMDAAKLQMTAKASQMPTPVADAFLSMEGLLSAAIGPQMNATFNAEDFSTNSGELDIRMDAGNGWLEALVRGREQSFRITKNKPVQAELTVTPPLRERLLYNIHPILADIRTTEHPIRATIPMAVVPFDDSGKLDVSKLRADIEITVGKVELDSGSTTLNVLSFIGQSKGRETIPGEIEPISAKIRNGIVKYDKFAVHIDQYTMNYSGQIDLVKRTVDLRTEVPLKALGQAVHELEPYADKINVPLVTRGKFGDVKTKIDPDFDLGKAALDAGFKGGLENLFKGKGSILDDLLNRGKKK